MVQTSQFLKQAMYSDRKQSSLGMAISDCETTVELYPLHAVSRIDGAGFGGVHCQSFPQRVSVTECYMN